MIDYEKYLRTEKMPLIWCPGCGHGIVMKSLIRAIDELELEQDNVCMVSGIGCSSRLTGYVDFNTLHTTHGRALAFATGIKMAKPRLHVIVVTGDGDATAIGGNHFIHAARRNIDLTVIVFNNEIYGMTGGKVSPATPDQAKASTAPYGSFENNFDIPELARAAGASFSARGTVYNAVQLEKLIKKAIQKMKGNAIIANSGRGGIVNETDLVEALNENLIRGAAIDVYTEEPLPGDHVYMNVSDPEKIILSVFYARFSAPGHPGRYEEESRLSETPH